MGGGLKEEEATVRVNKNVWLSHPTWYIVPGRVKDGGGDGGGTIQARITCKKSAHQTDPEEIRACYRSRWEGGSLVTMDLNQVELRVAALLSGDAGMVEVYQKNQDLHSRRAEAIWTAAVLTNLYPELAALSVDKWKSVKAFDRKERWVSKQINFADLFRSGVDTMQRTVLKDCGQLIAREFFEDVVRRRAEQRPGLWEWQEQLIREARENGKIQLPFTGQSRAFLGGDKYEVNEIVNFPVQATAGNTLLRIQARLSRRFWGHGGIKLFLNVYDALKWDCRDRGCVEELEGAIKEEIGWVEREEYWGWLQEKYGREVPLKYDVMGAGSK